MKNNISFPVIETTLRSFVLLSCNLANVAKICFPWVIVMILGEMVLGFPILLSFRSRFDYSVWKQYSEFFIILISYIGIICSLCRFVIKHEPPQDYYHLRFGKEEFSFLTGILYLATGIMLFLITLMLYVHCDFTPFEMIMCYMMFKSILYELMPPFLLFFAAAAVGNKQITLQYSWKVTKTNFFRILTGQIICSFPLWLLTMVISIFNPITVNSAYFAKLLPAMILVSIATIDACIKASYISHLYQYFIYYLNKKK